MVYSHVFLLLDAIYAKNGGKNKNRKNKNKRKKKNKTRITAQNFSNTSQRNDNFLADPQPSPYGFGPISLISTSAEIQNSVEPPPTDPEMLNANKTDLESHKQHVQRYKYHHHHHHHKHKVNDDSSDDDEDENDKNYETSHTESKLNKMIPFSMRYVPKSWCGIFTRVIALVSIFAAFWLTFESCFTEAVYYDIQGLLGLFVDPPIRAFSPVEVVQVAVHKTERKEAAFWLSVTFLLTVIVFPLLSIAMMIFTWFIPLTFKWTVWAHNALTVSCAWASLDVFMLASYAASQELDKVSKWILTQEFYYQGEPACGSKGIIDNITGMICFAVQGEITNAFWIGVAAVLLSWFVTIYSVTEMHWAKQDYKKRREEEAWF